MGQLFISYNRDDLTTVEALAAALQANGVSIWWDRAQPQFSHAWIDELGRALDQCSGYVVLVGEGGIDRWLKAELYIAMRKHTGSDGVFPVFPLLTAGAEPARLPSFLATLRFRRLPEHPVAEALESLSRELAAGGFTGPERPRKAAEVCPFPGLAAFGEDDERFFLGRELETAFGLNYLGVGADGIARRWLQVEGPRGCGKTSLVGAGIVPAIRKGWLGETQVSGACRVLAPMRPGADPVGNLAAVLAETYSVVGGADAIKLFLLAESSDQGLKHFFDDQETGAAVVLFVDQLEELLTIAEQDEEPVPDDNDEEEEEGGSLAAFDRLLAEAISDRSGPLLLITTLRSDFLPELSRKLPRLHTLLNENGTRLSLGQMDEKTLLRVIEQPVSRSGVHWDKSTLPRRLVKAAMNEPVAMPLLGNVLRMLWEKRYERKGATFLPTRYYDELHGLGSSLARSADSALDELDAADRDAAVNMLLRLVHFGDRLHCTRVAQPRELLLAEARDETRGERVLAMLAGQPAPDAPPGAAPRPRLVVLDGERVDMAHEILLQRKADDRPFWPTLYARLDRERERLGVVHRLQAMARAWHAGRSRELAGAADLKACRRAGPLPDDGVLRDFLAVSRARLRRSRWSRIARTAGGALGGLALLVPAYLAYRYQTGAQLELALETFPAAATVPETYDIFLDGQKLNGLTRYRLSLLEPGESHQVKAVAEGYYPATAELTAEAPGKASLALRLVAKSAVELPDMVVLPAGRFTMGSPDDEAGRDPDEAPLRDVDIRSFAIGRYEVRFAEYDVFARATERELPPDEDWGRGERPVIRVSWSDARAYAAWLSRLTGEDYRLPTESEWEYAARAGSTTRFWWGDEPDREAANYAGGEWEFTAFVGSFDPNPFDLYETAGNLWEWVRDCWHDSYENAPADGSAWLEAGGGDCNRHVVRGGSWVNKAVVLRSANRGKETDSGFSNVGFRLAKDVDGRQ